LLLALACPLFLRAQNTMDLLRAAFGSQDFGTARHLLGQAMSDSPLQLIPYLDDIEFMLLEHGAKEGKEIADRAQTDTLLKIYELGIAANDLQLPALHARRAMLATRYPDHYKVHALPWLKQALEAQPMECPLPIFSLLFTEAQRVTKAGLDSPQHLVLEWLRLDRQLYLRGLHLPEESEDCSRLARTLNHQMRAALPDCNLMASWIGASPGTSWTPENTLAYLAGAQLRSCDDTLLWAKVVDWAQQQPHISPEIARVLAAEAMQRGQNTVAMDWWQRAIQAETSPALAAADLLFQAELLKMQEDFKAARKLYEEASRLQPSWGEPYIRLVDLYRDGAMHCQLSAFDSKALNWLLIDLCKHAEDSDPSYAAEANRRIFSYELAMPTQTELRARGLKPGDTWPLRCWIGVAVKVMER
jgi:tetratricopeptide (TPR) repeat protein